MDLRAYFVATKDSPKSRAIMVKARKGRMPASPRDYPPHPKPPPSKGEWKSNGVDLHTKGS